jgi:hypothetical protein
MSTKSYIPILTVCKIITFKVEIYFYFFCLCPRGTADIWRLKTQVLKEIWNVALHFIVPKWVRYMSPKSHTQKKCGTCWKKSFSARGYDEIHIQRPVFPGKKHIGEIIELKIQTVSTCLLASWEGRIFSPKKTKISNFSDNSKSPRLIIFVLERGSENDWIRWWGWCHVGWPMQWSPAPPPWMPQP